MYFFATDFGGAIAVVHLCVLPFAWSPMSRPGPWKGREIRGVCGCERMLWGREKAEGTEEEEQGEVRTVYVGDGRGIVPSTVDSEDGVDGEVQEGRPMCMT